MSQNSVDITVRSTDQSARGLDQASKNAGKFKDTLREIGKTAAGVLTADIAMKAAQGFKNLVTDSVRQASDLNESLNAVNVTFGQSAKGITDWGNKNAASFGLSKSAFNALATPLGAMLKNTGLSMQDTSKWTIDLTKRAADMASVFNTSVPDALEAIQAGLRGEADPLERYGVGLSAAKVQAEALAETGKKAASSLSTQELATARLNIIMKQTAQTQGDFANTSDGAANAARIASAQFDNAKASLGNALLPILAKAATAAATLAEGFNSLPGPMQATIVIVGALGTAAVLLAPKIKVAKEELGKLGTAALAAETKMGAFARGAGKVAAGLAAVQAASAAMGHDASSGATTAADALEAYARTGKMASDVTGDLGYAMSTVGGSAGKAIAGTIENFTGLGSVFDNSIQHATESINSMDAGLASLVSGGKADAAAQAFRRLSDEAVGQGASLDDVKKAFPQYSEALAQAARQTNTTGGATEDLTKKLNDERDALNKTENALLAQRDAARGLEASYDNATDAIKKNGKTLDIGTEKGRANQAALDEIAGAAYKARDAIIEQGGSQADANAIMATARSRFVATATAMGLGAAKAQTLADKLFAIPKNTIANVTVSVNDSATRVLNGVLQRLATINGKTAYVNVAVSNANARESRATGGIVGTAATGGIRSNSTIVGEHGPEIVNLAPGSRVSSNPDTQRILSDLAGGFASAADAGTSAAMTAAIDKLMADAKRAGDKGAQNIIASYKKSLVDAVKKRDSTDDALKSAITDARKNYVDFVESTKSGIVGGGGGAVSTGSFDSITGQITRQLQSAREFASVLSKLKKAGLDQTSMQQLIAAGPDQGLAAARTILSAGGAGIKQISGLQSQLAAAGGAVGTAGAEALYRKGITDAEAARDKNAGYAKADASVERIAAMLEKALTRKLGHRATGGIAGGRTMVGESGPEVVDLPPGSNVRSNPDTMRMLGGASGGVGTVVLEVVSSGSRMSDLLLDVIREAVRVRGGNVQAVIGRG